MITRKHHGGKDSQRRNYLTHRKRRQNQIKLEFKDILRQWRDLHPCTDCGENDISKIETHHVRGIKLYNISEAISSGKINTKKQLYEELAKCEGRCITCHIRTNNEA